MQVFTSKESIGDLAKTGVNTVQLAQSVITIGGKQYSTNNLVCDLTLSGVGGIDIGSVQANKLYYVYAVVYSGNVVLIASLSIVSPIGFLRYVFLGRITTDYLSKVDEVINHGEILTAEVRFEGSNSRGATDTSIVKFDTQAKIRGSHAFTVVNNAANGTVITINKKGRLKTSGVLFLNAASSYLVVTKSQINLATLPLTSEVVVEGYLNATNSMYNLSGTTNVDAGDVIRVYSQNNPGATSPGNVFHLFFEETITTQLRRS